MTVVNAKLVKRKTEDDLVEVFEHVPLGKVYRVLLESRLEYEVYNVPTKRVVKREMILDVDVHEWLPTELLEIEGGAPCPTWCP